MNRWIGGWNDGRQDSSDGLIIRRSQVRVLPPPPNSTSPQPLVASTPEDHHPLISQANFHGQLTVARSEPANDAVTLAWAGAALRAGMTALAAGLIFWLRWPPVQHILGRVSELLQAVAR
jgi:hypothetical protein